MTPTSIIVRFWEALKSPNGILGALFALWHPVIYLIGRLGDLDFLHTYWPQIRDIANSGWGVALSTFLGLCLIARAIYKTSHPPVTTTQGQGIFAEHPTAVPNGKDEQPHKNEDKPKTDLEWGFERYKNFYFVGMSAPDGKIVVHQFQATGRNLTEDPITNARGYVRSDKTNIEYPIVFNIAGVFHNHDEINPIPVGSGIDVRAYFTPDQKPITLEKFFGEFVPFTFFFEYNDKKYRHTFIEADIEPIVEKYAQAIRKKSFVPPHMTAKAKAAGQLRMSLMDFVNAAKKLDWDISGVTNLQIMDLLDGLRQQGADGLRLWGKLSRYGDHSFLASEPLVDIPTSHWKDFEIEIGPVVRGEANEKTHTYSSHNSASGGNGMAGGYVDLQVESETALKWLRDEAPKLKGRRDARKK